MKNDEGHRISVSTNKLLQRSSILDTPCAAFGIPVGGMHDCGQGEEHTHLKVGVGWTNVLLWFQKLPGKSSFRKLRNDISLRDYSIRLLGKGSSASDLARGSSLRSASSATAILPGAKMRPGKREGGQNCVNFVPHRGVHCTVGQRHMKRPRRKCPVAPEHPKLAGIKAFLTLL